MNKDFFNVSKIINNNSKKEFNYQISEPQIKHQKLTNKDKIKLIKKKINQKDSSAVVSYDEASRLPVTFPKKFNWRLFAKIVNNPSVNNEEKAIEHFKKYAHNQSKIAKLYFRSIYNIPVDFDEDSYIDYLKTFNLNLDKSSIEIEKLYHFFSKSGYTKYPLNDQYYRILYRIPYHFDYISYCNRYSNVEFDKNNVNSIYNYFSSDKNTKHHLDDEYGRLKYNIPSHFCPESYKKRYNLSFENNFDLYEYYNKNEGKGFNLDDKYLEIRFNIPNDFNIDIFKQRYSEIKNMDKLSIFNFYNNDLNKLDDSYYRILYNIPIDFDCLSYVERYPNTKSNLDIDIYKYYHENSNSNKLDDQYYRILYNIPQFFDISIYTTLYKNVKGYNQDIYEFYNLNKENYSLNEEYFKLLFNLNHNDYLDWKNYRDNFICDKSLSMYDTFSHFANNQNKDIYYKQVLNLDESFDWNKYFIENKDYFLLDEDVLDINESFVFNFISEKIKLEDIYNNYIKNNNSKISNDFINNYNFINKNILTETDKRSFFNLYSISNNFEKKYNEIKGYYQNYEEDKVIYETTYIEKIIDNYNELNKENFRNYINQKIKDLNVIEDENQDEKEYLSGNNYNYIKVLFDNNDCSDIINYFDVILLVLETNYSNNNDHDDNIVDNLDIFEEENKNLKKYIQDLKTKYKRIIYSKRTCLDTLYSILNILIERYEQIQNDNNNFYKCIKNEFNNNLSDKSIDSILYLNNYKSFFNKDSDEIINNLEKYKSLYKLNIEKIDINDDLNINLIKDFYYKKKEIIVFIFDNFIHNTYLLDYYLEKYSNEYKVTIIVNNFSFLNLKDYKNIDKINIINLNNTIIDINTINNLYYNENFWKMFNSEYLFLTTNNVFLYDLNQDLLHKSLMLIDEQNGDNKPLQILFVNKNYILNIINNYKNGNYLKYYNKEFKQIQKQYNLDNMLFNIFLKCNIKYDNLGINNLIYYLSI